jgi:crotonobetainyl-CoA:carnitine CoA-transferase CaiB-like acyl-CoA transferase
MVRVSGFGQSGPYSEKAGGSVAEAMGGIRYLTGYPDQPPTRTGVVSATRSPRSSA